MAEAALIRGSHRELSLGDEQAVELHRLMLMTRAIDDRIWALNRQGRVGITAPCRGHEAAQVGCARAFVPERDVFVPYYRDLGMAVALGYGPYELLLDAIGKAEAPFTAGRQMPFHWTSTRLKLLSPSSSVGTHIPHGVGAALASKIRGEWSVTLVSFGDGATSKGDFHEGLNFAAIHKLPVVFYCENNLYAISVPIARQMAVRNVADRAAGYGMPGVVVDGNDVLAVLEATRQAVEYCLAGSGPILLEAKTYRLMPHTSNDDDSIYRGREEVEEWRGRDPITRYAAYLREAGLLDEAGQRELGERVAAEVAEASQRALEAPEPRAETALDRLFAPGTPNAPRLDPEKQIPEELVQALKSEIGA
jgi:2-oxoisovalerate dehydrogenase E1 component alpha subunit